jgi:PmbA protein
MRTDRVFSEHLLDMVLSRGASRAEVYQKASRTLAVDVKDRGVESVESSLEFGYAVRVLRNQKLGFSYSSDKAEAEKVVDSALDCTRITEADENLGFPASEQFRETRIFDETVESLSQERALEMAFCIEKAALEHDRRMVKVRKAAASFTQEDTLLVNSQGFSSGYLATSVSARVMTMAEEKGDGQMGWDFQAGRFVDDISFVAVGTRGAERAVRLLGARHMRPVKAPLLLDSLVSTEFLSLLAAMLSSEQVQKGKSLLGGRTNQQVMSSSVCIIDDGVLEGGVGTRPFDDEGVASQTTELVSDGVLRGFLYNAHTAKKEGARSTGNATRRGSFALPSVGVTNFSLQSRDNQHSVGDLLRMLESGLYVTEAMGIHTANSISGDFSIGVSGLWIQQGSAAYPVKEAVISGNLLDLFRDVQATGDDLRFFGGIGAPSLLVGPTDISA